MTDRQTNDPLSYLGVRSPKPSNLVRASRAPLTSDNTSADGTLRLGDRWLDTSNNNIYSLVSTAANIATWKAEVLGTSDIGTVNLVEGTITVADSKISSNDIIFIQRISVNDSTALGSLTYEITPEVEFVISSIDQINPPIILEEDISTVSFQIIKG